MNVQHTSQTSFEDIKVNVKLKLAALWACFMFLYIYVDYFHLYMPGQMDAILKGKVFLFDITQSFIISALSLLTIPTLMISLSAALPAKPNRLVNIIVALLYIPFTLINLAGLVWAHMVFAAVVEVALLLLVIYYAWKWPRVESSQS